MWLPRVFWGIPLIEEPGTAIAECVKEALNLIKEMEVFVTYNSSKRHLKDTWKGHVGQVS